MGHIHDLIDFTITGYVVCNKKVLMVSHKKLKRWLPPGGHIELNEDPEEALFRELEEETGLTKNKLVILGNKPKIKTPGTKFLYSPKFLDIHEISLTHKHVGMVYFLKSETDKKALADREHSDIKWFSVKDLEDPKYNLLSSIKFYANEAIKLNK